MTTTKTITAKLLKRVLDYHAGDVDLLRDVLNEVAKGECQQIAANCMHMYEPPIESLVPCGSCIVCIAREVMNNE